MYETAFQHCVALREFPVPDDEVYFRFRGRKGTDPLVLIFQDMEGETAFLEKARRNSYARV